MINPLKFVQPVMYKAANNRFMDNHVKKYSAKKAGMYLAGFSVASIVSKDALGCYYYVTQSLKNEKIPEEKRKFVAALDLANGVLMIATQVLLTLTFAKAQKRIFKKMFKKFFDGEAVNKIAKKLPQEVTAGMKPEKVAKKTKKAVKQIKEECLSGFSVITSLVVASILAKRAIVPFVSTPAASWVKEKIIEKGENKDTIENLRNMKVSYEHMMNVHFKNNENMKKLYAIMKGQNKNS